MLLFQDETQQKPSHPDAGRQVPQWLVEQQLPSDGCREEIQKLLDLCGIQGGPSAWLPNDAPNLKYIYQTKRVPSPCFVLVCVFLHSLVEDVEDKNLSAVMI